MRVRLASLPAIIPASGIVAGILLYFCGAGGSVAIAVCAAGIALSATRRHYPAAGMYAAAAGWLAAYMAAPVPAPETVFDGHPHRYSGTVTASSVSRHGQSAVVLIDSVDGIGTGARFAASVATPDASGRLAVGARVQVSGDAEPVHPITDFPHQRDAAPYRLQHGITANIFARPDSIRITGREHSAASRMYDRREQIEEFLAQSGLDDRAFAILSALLIGDRDYMPERLSDNIRSAGVAHVLALSGFHVGIIVLMTSLALFPLRLWPRLRLWRYAVGMAAAWGYAFLTGLSPSVMRAALVLTVYMAGKMLGRGTRPLNALCVSVAVIAAVSPTSVFSAGFQLSVAAVLGILAFTPLINRVPPRRRLLRGVVGLVALPVAAMAGTAIPTLLYFNSLPVWFLVGNVYMSLLMPVLVSAGVIVVICGYLNIGCHALAETANVLCASVDNFTEWLASIPWAQTPPIFITPLMALILAIIPISIWMMCRTDSARTRALLSAAAPCALLASACVAERKPATEILTSGGRGHTEIVMRHGDTIAAVVTANPLHLESIHGRVEEHWADFAASRGCPSVNIVDYDFDFGPFSRRGSVLQASSRTVAIALGRGEGLPPHADYVLVTPRYRGTGPDLCARIGADTIVLGRDLSLRKSLLWLEWCRSAGQPVIDMRERPWRIPL